MSGHVGWIVVCRPIRGIKRKHANYYGPFETKSAAKKHVKDAHAYCDAYEHSFHMLMHESEHEAIGRKEHVEIIDKLERMVPNVTF